MRQTLNANPNKRQKAIKVKIAMFFAVRLWVCLEIISAIKLLKSRKNPIINPMTNILFQITEDKNLQ